LASANASLVAGYALGVDAKPVLRCCRNCHHIEEVSDSTENVTPAYVCHMRPHMMNLRGFPFATELKCFELHMVNSTGCDAQE